MEIHSPSTTNYRIEAKKQGKINLPLRRLPHKHSPHREGGKGKGKERRKGQGREGTREGRRKGKEEGTRESRDEGRERKGNLSKAIAD